jgi:hypothetical protein
MQSSGLHARPRVASEGSACERFELDRGAMTLGWSSEGDLLCIMSGVAGEGFAAPLEARILEVLGATGRVRLWLDLFDLSTVEEGFCESISRFFGTYGERIREARAVVAHAAAQAAVERLNVHLGGRIEVLGDPESQAELYARFAQGA